MITTKKFNELYKVVNASRCDRKVYGKQEVAVICGPSIIIEMVVKKASMDSGIPMDWNYFGGRGIVWTTKSGDVKACRRSLFFNLPKTDLSQSDV